jgi:hypothetical protein
MTAIERDFFGVRDDSGVDMSKVRLPVSFYGY